MNERIIWVFVVVDKLSQFIRSGHCSGMTLSHLVKSGFASFLVLSPVGSAWSEEKVGRRVLSPAPGLVAESRKCSQVGQNGKGLSGVSMTPKTQFKKKKKKWARD